MIKIQFIFVLFAIISNIHCAEQNPTKTSSAESLPTSDDAAQTITRCYSTVFNPNNVITIPAEKESKETSQFNVLDRDAKNKLILAVYANDLLYVQKYINDCISNKKKPNFAVRDPKGNTLLNCAISSLSGEEISARKKISENLGIYDLNSAYLESFGHNKMFKLLLENGADPLIDNLIITKDNNGQELINPGYSLIRQVISKGNVFALKLLINKLAIGQIDGGEVLNGLKAFENKMNDYERIITERNAIKKSSSQNTLDIMKAIYNEMEKLINQKFGLDQPPIFPPLKQELPL